MNRCGDKVKGPVAHRINGRFNSSMASEDNHRNSRICRANPFEQLFPGHLRHLQIGDDQIDMLLVYQGPALLSILRQQHLMAAHFKGTPKTLADIFLVIYNENRKFHSFSPFQSSSRFSLSGIGKLMVKVVPWFSLECTDTSPLCSRTTLYTTVNPKPEPNSLVV